MPQAEFDAVHYFVNEPGRAPAPPEDLAVYLASTLTQPALAEQLDTLVADLRALVPGFDPVATSWASAGEAPAGAEGGPDDRTRAALRAGQVEMLQVSLADDMGRRLILSLVALPGDPAASLGLSIAGEDNPWPDGPDPMAERLLQLVLRRRHEWSLTTAGITYDRSGLDRTAWERWYSAPDTLMLPAATEHVRGYFWANLLTPGHLAAYGGEFPHRAESAGMTVVPAGDGVLVRDPGPITAFTDDRLAAMKKLLTPVLLDRAYLSYQGYPLRIVRDPGTAFRQVPPGDPVPRVF
ncbi:hypothetical protein GCM10010435_40670 [Winogradskya consettensis]|uniref:Uncharacterized protein n=2 Tax=Winogradskya consettensis TaxID=113560 RepID=A0A919VU99_9ACTN|nr:hypothetical protein Aco04nite_16800 [Actinoplanes consettensis]